MVTKQATIERIREIINKHYTRLVISTLGSKSLTKEELAEARKMGLDTSNPDSLLSMVYYHNFINNPVTPESPTSVEDMKAQQSQPGAKPKGEANDYTVESLNEKMKQYVEKMKLDVQTRVEGIIRQNNDEYKFNALRNLDRSDIADSLVKESSIGKVKQLLRDTAKDGTRDWQRVALTEMSNAIGVGSVDRIVTDNRSANMDDVFVYRVPVNDAITCKYCRRFYNDSDMSPKLYRLSTLLANGSNYNKKPETWQPVVGATHPNTRTSQIIELKPGFKLMPGGRVTYIGLDKWRDYVHEKLVG